MATEATTMKGTPISPGAAFGYAIREEPLAPLSAEAPELPLEQVGREVARLERALSHVSSTLEEHVREYHAPHEGDEKDILAAHVLMVDDAEFRGTIADRIRSERVPAEYAVEHSFTEVASRLVFSGDPYLRARAEEIRDLCQSVRRALHEPKRPREPARTGGPAVYVSPSLSATGVLRARRAQAVAFVTSSAAFTSHGAILLRASGIPALGGVDLGSIPLETGTPLLVDATDGRLVVRPDAAEREVLKQRGSNLSERRRQQQPSPRVIDLEDGSSLYLYGNIDHPSQVEFCLRQRMSGVGLFRTEFLVLEAGHIPGEEEQFERYRSVFDQLGSLPATVRTFDLGGDKTVAGLHHCTGPNPALGVRGIRRHILRHPDEFKTQLRAVLRAAAGHKVGLLLPMVTNPTDVVEARKLLEAARSELRSAGQAVATEIRLGAMIEIPSAALNVAAILPHADFLSIGTNDLLQYLTASDRDNDEVVHYQDAESSGLYPLLETVMTTARAAGREDDVAVCGELASSPDGARSLVRIGIRSLSVSPAAAPGIRQAFSSLETP